nr:hypothetical protein [Muribaculaceae bacterium]
SNYNWDTFTKDMNGSLVDMKTSYDENGVFTMNSTITTSSGTKYNYSYKKTIASKPKQITLFFVNEKSYIDGSSLDTGVDNVYIDDPNSDNRIFNVWGQEVDENYKGIVIKNGRKIIQR